ncbi:MAG: hypothetical protein K2J32_07255 [Ruminococcus sp.]|nr:hypothetical protein [Ruminococcus sp.]
MKKKKKYKGYKREVPENIRVVTVEVPAEFTTETRYVIINSDTGEVFDDAQGYGYRTPQKAYAAFNWKKKSPEEHAEQELKKKEVQEWCRKYKSVARQIEDIIFISVKERVPYTVQEILEVIPEEAKAEMTFTIRELLKYF